MTYPRKGQYTKIYNERLKLNTKKIKKKSIKRQAEDMNRYFTKEDRQLTDT